MTDRPPIPQETVATRAAFRAGVKGLRYTENPDPGFDPRRDRQRARTERETLQDPRAPAGPLRPRGRLRDRAGAAHDRPHTRQSELAGRARSAFPVPAR
jgi:hypothetical protein